MGFLVFRIVVISIFAITTIELFAFSEQLKVFVALDMKLLNWIRNNVCRAIAKWNTVNATNVSIFYKREIQERIAELRAIEDELEMINDICSINPEEIYGSFSDKFQTLIAKKRAIMDYIKELEAELTIIEEWKEERRKKNQQKDV